MKEIAKEQAELVNAHPVQLVPSKGADLAVANLIAEEIGESGQRQKEQRDPPHGQRQDGQQQPA